MKLRDILSVLRDSQEIKIWSLQCLRYCYEGVVSDYKEMPHNPEWIVVTVEPVSYGGVYEPFLAIEIDDREWLE